MRAFLALLLLLALPTYADDLPSALQKVVKDGGVVVKSFPAPDGLTGWVIRIQGKPYIVYTTPGGGYVMSGVLLDSEGRNLTQEYQGEYVPQPDAGKAAAALNSDTWLVDEGKAGAPLIYVYADPNCAYCNKFWTDLRPYVAAGKVHVRWALLAFLKGTSMGRAAAILAAPNRAKALAEDEAHFDHAHEEGGIPELKPVSPDIQTVLGMHDEQMNEAGAQGTPTILIRHKDGWALSYGAPTDMEKFIADLDR
jgi:thiol:disulfide interchange protein DsbG